MVEYRGLEIDRRIGIAMTVLSPSQRQAVEKVIGSVATFALAVARPGHVRVLPTSGQPLFMMRVSDSLRLVYTKVGRTFYVLDVIEKRTLDALAAKKGQRARPSTKPSASPTKTKAGAPPAAAEK